MFVARSVCALLSSGIRVARPHEVRLKLAHVQVGEPGSTRPVAREVQLRVPSIVLEVGLPEVV
jgi:hypothetical protein